MKSFKHIISYTCDKNCSYCINEILVHNEKQCKEPLRIADAYKEMALVGYDHIMLSGGEPVLNKMFKNCLGTASMMFDHVSIISAHVKTLSHSLINKLADDVLFSIHAEYLEEGLHPVYLDIPVYASMIVETYDLLKEQYDDVPFKLQQLGFSGMTIRECYPDGKELSDTFNSTDSFTIRIYKKSRCVEDSVLLLPDLSTTTQQEFA